VTDRLSADPAGIERAAALLRDGELVAFPTDTVYGIGCRADDPDALARILAAKRRPPEKAVPLLVANLAAAVERGFVADEQAARLAAHFWPGGLTLVLPSATGALALLAAAGPLATSSANRSGEPETLDADDVLIAFADGDEPSAVVDGGRVPGGVASSVVDLSGDRPRVVREGAVARGEIEALIGPID